jgi:hypothetical protein
MDEHMTRVFAFQSALKTLDTLFTWFCIWIPSVLGWAGALVFFGMYPSRPDTAAIAVAIAVGVGLYAVLAHFIKTLTLGMAYTLVAIAHNTEQVEQVQGEEPNQGAWELR